MNKTIITLPESDQTTLCLKVNGIVTAEDYLNHVDIPLRAIVAAHGFFNICTIYDTDFEGWSREAADLSFKNISDLAANARKVAYVNTPDSRRLLIQMMKPMMKAEIVYFESDDEAKAIAWTKS